MSATDPSPLAAEGTARVSTKRGWWSIGLPLLSVAVASVAGFGSFIVLGRIFGTVFDPEFQVAYRVTSILFTAVFIGMLATAVVLGVRSIGDAWPQRGRPRRAMAIVLGCVGIALSVLILWILVLPALDNFSTPAVWS